MSLMNRLQRLTGEDDRGSDEKSGAARTRRGTAVQGDPRPAGEDRGRSLPATGGTKAWAPPAGRGRGVPLEDLVPGTEEINEAGVFFCAHRLAGGSYRHGERCIRDLAPLDMGRLAVLANDPALRGLDYRRALFLDTETTGLAGGTGTVAFLIGLGWFEGDGSSRSSCSPGITPRKGQRFCTSEKGSRKGVPRELQWQGLRRQSAGHPLHHEPPVEPSFGPAPSRPPPSRPPTS